MSGKWAILFAWAVLLPPAGWAAADAGTPAASQPGGPAVVATVNGQPITRERMAQLLIEAHGKLMLEFVASLEVAKQEALAKGLTIAPADIAAEEADSIPEGFKNLNPAERDRQFDDYLQRNQLTRVDWRLVLERNAYLRKLAAGLPEPKEDELRALFNRQYGERVQVADIKVKTQADMTKVEKRFEAGERFELVAREMSIDKAAAANGGVLPPFDRNDSSVPKEIRDSAFSLKDIFDVQERINVGDSVHMIRLMKRIPPSNIHFEDVRDKLAAQVRSRNIRLQMKILLQNLYTNAKIDVVDPVLKAQTDVTKTQEPPPTLPAAGKDR